MEVGRSRDWALVVDREPRRRCDRHYCRLEKAVLESYIGETAKEIFRMARVFVTGSADGLGKMAAELLIEQGHKVVLHARSAARAEETRKKVGGAEHIVVGDLSSIADTKSVADQVNRLGRFAVIHNAGIGYREPQLVKTVDGLPQLFAVNTLAPYLLTALIITMPKGGWCICLPACTTAPDRISTTCCGRNGDGTVLKPTPKPSFRTCCCHSRLHGIFPK